MNLLSEIGINIDKYPELFALLVSVTQIDTLVLSECVRFVVLVTQTLLTVGSAKPLWSSL